MNPPSSALQIIFALFWPISWRTHSKKFTRCDSSAPRNWSKYWLNGLGLKQSTPVAVLYVNYLNSRQNKLLKLWPWLFKTRSFLIGNSTAKPIGLPAIYEALAFNSKTEIGRASCRERVYEVVNVKWFR